MKRLFLFISIFLFTGCVVSESMTTRDDDIYYVSNSDVQIEIINDICYVYVESPTLNVLSRFYFIDNFYYHWCVNRYIPVVFPKWQYWCHHYHYYDSHFHYDSHIYHPKIIYGHNSSYKHVDRIHYNRPVHRPNNEVHNRHNENVHNNRTINNNGNIRRNNNQPVRRTPDRINNHQRNNNSGLHSAPNRTIQHNNSGGGFSGSRSSNGGSRNIGGRR